MSLDQARTAARNWVRQRRSLDGRIGQAVVSARTRTAANGAEFHIVKMDTGFIVTTADTTLEPVVVHSDGADVVEDERNPLWVLLRKTIELRTSVQSKTVFAASPNAAAKTVSAEDKWAQLLADEPAVQVQAVAGIAAKNVTSVTSVADVRVAPLVQSKWNQDVVGTKNVYNYYTPNNYVCGCVATAGSQIMRYFQWPQTSVAKYTCRYCGVDGVQTTLTSQGGTYDWANMPLEPSSSITETQRKAIGKLTSDVGICVAMEYSSDGSGTGGYVLQPAFTESFGYSNAMSYQIDGNVPTADVKAAFVSNFDAGLPVELSIGHSTRDDGHSIVGDGYGYSGTTLYYHLNFGWSGQSNAWYAPPDMGSYDVLSGFVYNIYTNQAAKAVICSGRVLDEDGNPVAGATVMATQGDVIRQTKVSNEKGIYAFVLPAGSYAIEGTSGRSAGSRDVTLKACVSTRVCDRSTSDCGSYYVSPTPVVNNLCEQDLVLEPTAPANVFSVSPYVQHPTADGMTILFFTTEDVKATVKVWPVAEAATVREKATVPEVATDVNATWATDDKLIWGTQYRHRVRFDSLTGGTRYRYAVEPEGAQAYTNFFSTAPDRDTPVRFVAYSDSECIPPTYRDKDGADENGCTKEWDVKGYSSRQTYWVSRSEGFASNLVHMAAWQPNLFVIAGDLVARGGVQMFWDEFWKENAGGLGLGYNDPAGSVPILAVTGNHDNYDNNGQTALSYGTSQQGECGITKYLSYFEFNPNGVDYANASGAHADEKYAKDRSQMFHREDYGPVTLIFVDTNNEKDSSGNDTNTGLSSGSSGARAPGFKPGTLQYEWLTNNLADAQAKSRFTFVINHHCPYSRGKHNKAGDAQCGLVVRAHLSDVMVRYGVDGWLCGHEEAQELAELKGQEVRPDGTTRDHTVYIYDLGSGGDGLKGAPQVACDEVVYRAYSDCADGTHYGHLQVEVKKDDKGVWTCTMAPAYSYVTESHSSELRYYEGARRTVTGDPDPMPRVRPYTHATWSKGETKFERKEE